MFTFIFWLVFVLCLIPVIITGAKEIKICKYNDSANFRQDKKDHLSLRRWILTGIIPIVWIIVWTVFSILSEYATSYWWYQEVGRTDVFWILLIPKIKIFLATFGIIMISFSVFAVLQYRNTVGKKLSLLIPLGISFLFAWIMASTVSSEWTSILMYLNYATTGITDPIFGKDASYYLFCLPVYDDLLMCAKGIMIFGIVYALGCWFFASIEKKQYGVWRVNTDKLKKFPHAIWILAALWCGIHVIDIQLSIYQLIYADHGLFSGINYVADNVRIPTYNSEKVVFAALGLIMLIIPFFKNLHKIFRILSYATIFVMFAGLIMPLFFGTFHVMWLVIIVIVAAILAGYLLLWGRKMNSELLLLVNVVITIIFVQFFVNNFISPVCIEAVHVSPNQKQMEAKYIKNNIDWTRIAFNLTDNNLTQQQIQYSEELTKEMLVANRLTVDNIRILDYDATVQILDNTQTDVQYYDFPNVDIDRYGKNDTLNMYFTGARQMNQEGLSVKTYYNTKYVYGHGYGYTKAKGNAYSIESGYPTFEIKGMPITSGEPRIYYQEGQSTDFFYVNSNEYEIDYPVEKGEKKYKYTGTGGINIKEIFKKLCFAKEYDWRLAFGAAPINDTTRIMIKRTINERLEAICPFITWDKDALFVIRPDGKTAWIVDGYSTSQHFPYASKYEESCWGEESNEFNYIRNSVKAVVDPFNGTIQLYLVNEKNDPITATLKNIFPTMFKPLSEMPEDLKAHLLYPIRYFKAQTSMELKYHMDDPYEFYQQDKIWRIAFENYKGERVIMEPRYMLVKLPGEKKERFVITIPFTPKEKNDGSTRDFLTGWAVGGCDQADFLKMKIYVYPKGKEIFGPWMIENQTNTESQISKTFTLLGQAGSTVWQGNLMLVPIENTVISIEPMIVLAKTEDGKAQLPSIRMIIAFHNKRIAWGRNTEEALYNLVSDIKPQEMESFTGPVKSIYDQYEVTVPVIDKDGNVTSKTITAPNQQKALEEMSKAIQKFQEGLNILQGAVRTLSGK